MAQSPAEATTTRFIDPVVRPIVKATDLGSVQVLKQGNVYLLTDPFGDVHADSRGLGLYDGDTRRLSSSILRINGERPVLLQASAGGNYHGAIQLTNPRLERNVADKVRPEDALASQKLGIARHRVIAGDSLEERVTIVNYAEHDEQVEVTLELAADAADIFEVRGWTRADRGRQLPIAARPGPGHVPLRGHRRPADRDPRRLRRAGRRRRTRGSRDRRHRQRRLGPVHLALADGLGRGAGAALGRLGRSSDRCRRRRRAPPRTSRPTTRCSRPSRSSRSTRSPPRTTPGAGACRRSRPTTSSSTSRSPARRATCGSWSTTAPATRSATSPPASRGSRRCSGGTRSSRRSRPCACGPRSRSRRSRCWPRSRPRTRTRNATRSPARSSTSCARARWRAPASCRSAPTTARSTPRRCG